MTLFQILTFNPNVCLVFFVVVFGFFETAAHCVVQAGRELTRILPCQSTECWDYRQAPPCLAFKF